MKGRGYVDVTVLQILNHNGEFFILPLQSPLIRISSSGKILLVEKLSESGKVVVFARKASGLVRVMSPYSAFAYNILNIGVIFPWVYLYGAGLWADSNIPLAILMTGGITTLTLAVVYAGLASAMPRTGGDYVFQSRTLGPWLGFPICALMVLTFFNQWQALAGWLTAILGFAPMFTSLGLVTRNTGMTDLGLWFTTPIGIWITSVVWTGIATAVFIRGFRLFVRLQWIMWYGFLLSYFLMIYLFATTPNDVFIQRFNTDMAILAPNTPDYYHYIINQVAAAGYTPATGFSWNSTILVMPIALTSLGWVGYAQEQAGEIAGAQSLKNQVFINVCGAGVSTIMMAILAYVLMNTVNQQWLSAAAYGAVFTGSVSMPIPPWFSNLAAVLSDNPVIVFLITFGVLMNAIQVVFNVPVGWTRIAMAASIDGILPRWISDVNEKTGTPIKVHLLFFVTGGMIMPYIYNFVPGYYQYTLAVTAAATVFYIGTSLGGAIFPFKNKEIYQVSAISKYRIAGAPVITVCGILATLFALWMLFYYLTVPDLGVANPASEAIMFLIFLFWVFVYAVRRAQKKRQGLELDWAFKEVPPL